MPLQIIGCSHHSAQVDLRERLAFAREEIPRALEKLRSDFPHTEAVLLSTCNRVELYTAAENPDLVPKFEELIDFLSSYHGLQPADVARGLFRYRRDAAVRHLFCVAASLDSMVVGEAQILAQVRDAYQLACQGAHTGPVTHRAFQAAMRVARRVARETDIHKKRVSIPSVAICDFASRIFQRLDDKQILVIGAGEMALETMMYLKQQDAQHITVINRSPERAKRLAEQFAGNTSAWENLDELLVSADLVVSTTGAAEPVVTLDRYRRIEPQRYQRTLFVLDLAVPRDFDPCIGDCLGVYLYSIDDLQKVCQENLEFRRREWSKAQRIIDDETARFLSHWNHRLTGTTIRQLKASADQIKRAELARLLNKLGELTDAQQAEIEQSFDRVVNKLLHPPMASLRDEAEKGLTTGLVDALKRLFQLGEP